MKGKELSYWPNHAACCFHPLLAICYLNESLRQFLIHSYQLSKQFHPDANASKAEENIETYKKKFQEVSEAYATLGSEKSRWVGRIIQV